MYIWKSSKGPHQPVSHTHTQTLSVCERYLGMIGPQYDPTAEAVSHVNGGCTATEADHVRKCGSQCHNQDLWARRETCAKRQCIVTSKQKRREEHVAVCTCVYFSCIRCISGKRRGSEWLRPKPAEWTFPAGFHKYHRMTRSRNKRQ